MDPKQREGMRKTRLCEKFMQTGSCGYGDKCTFAHGWVGRMMPCEEWRAARQLLPASRLPSGHAVLFAAVRVVTPPATMSCHPVCCAQCYVLCSFRLHSSCHAMLPFAHSAMWCVNCSAPASACQHPPHYTRPLLPASSTSLFMHPAHICLPPPHLHPAHMRPRFSAGSTSSAAVPP